MIKVCVICKKEYKVRGKKRKESSKYCSNKCHATAKTGNTPWNKGKKYSKQQRENMSKTTKRLWENDEYRKKVIKSQIGRTGELSSNWQGGKTEEQKRIRNSDELNKWRKSIFKRDNYTCRRCGKTNTTIHAHHILFFAKHKEYRTEIQNGITFCKECHIDVHKRLRQQEKILQQINTKTTLQL